MRNYLQDTLRILADQLGLDESEITPDKDLYQDLHADSLHTVELLMAVEDEYDIEIDDADAEKCKKVSDIVAYLERRNAGNQRAGTSARKPPKRWQPEGWNQRPKTTQEMASPRGCQPCMVLRLPLPNHQETNKMKHIDELIETLEMVSQMLADHEDAEPEDGRLEMRAAGQLRRLKTALEDANGICRSAMAIAERGGRETNWDAFTGQLRESLQRQHAVMYPPENAPVLAHADNKTPTP